VPFAKKTNNRMKNTTNKDNDGEQQLITKMPYLPSRSRETVSPERQKEKRDFSEEKKTPPPLSKKSIHAELRKKQVNDKDS
jgi:hypothetical protein